MFPLKSLYKRSESDECMDSPAINGKDLEESFRFIGFVNLCGGGYKTAIRGLEKALGAWPKSRPVEILDVGCGTGGMGLALSMWGKSRGFDIRYTGIDKNEWVVRLAIDKSESQSIRYRVGDLFDTDLPEADFVMASMVFHHLSDQGLVNAIAHLLNKSRHALIVNDLIRSHASYALCYMLTRFTNNSICRNDALLSVKKGFRVSEMKKLLEDLRIVAYIEKRPLGRLLITIPNPPPDFRGSKI
jgi:2-polyprenyl-3-methyl-5-hydroxy-6-metoxy-1,4-benzoquinol methylase